MAKKTWTRMVDPGRVIDKRQKRWETLTFMGMVAAMMEQSRWAKRGVAAGPNIRMPGFPLDIPHVGEPGSRSSTRRTRQKSMRRSRQARIRRRGWS